MGTFINNTGNFRNKTLNSTNKTLNINYKVQSISPNSSLFCPVCNIPFTYKIRINPCYHIICKTCYKLSLQDQKCLMCNNDINDIENIFIKDQIYICPHNDCKKGFINEKSYQYHIYFKHKFLKEKNEINRKGSNNSNINHDIHNNINDTINYTIPEQKNNNLGNFNINLKKGGMNISLSSHTSQWPNELIKNSLDSNINANMNNLNNINNVNTNDKSNLPNNNNNINPFDIKAKKLQEGNEPLFTNITTTNKFMNTNKMSTSNILTNNNNITSNNNYKFLNNVPGTDTWTNSVFSIKSNFDKDVNTNKGEQNVTDVQNNKNNQQDDELDNLEDFM
ncbi:zinc finger protein, putative [Plasmodium reichenowi]|uniref:Zinc finger protein, putative n=1 Tax=Plasmodium reichenowi TaxID=5854 RepID=A0A2P9D4D7_PLARE|nr:zinc finger protein, putative [Plasmodium reichenowi]